MELFVIVFLVVVLAGAGWYIFTQLNKKNSGVEQAADQFKEFFKMSLDQQNEMRRQLDERLKHVTDSMQQQGRNIGERLDNAAKVVNTVNQKLSTLEESNKKIHDVGKDIASLQEILRAPKLRGGLGELFLENILSQILPRRDLYALQYSFKSAEKVDAVIFLKDSMMVSVDSKFPLENFKKMVECDPADEKKTQSFRKLFFSDVKKHVDSIASKYILPSEGTLDFALMYIPAENVYYETITKDLENESSVCQYALSKRVIPVSPNTFYIYLQTLLVGLQGMQVEKNAQNILKSLSQLRTDFGKFAEAFELVGTHLNHTSSSYEKSEKSLEKLGSRFALIDGGQREQRAIEAAAVEETVNVR